MYHETNANLSQRAEMLCMRMKIIVVEMGIFTNCFFFLLASSFHSFTNKLLAKYQKALWDEKWKWIYYSALLINYAVKEEKNVCHADYFICFHEMCINFFLVRNELKARKHSLDLSHFNYIYQQDICLCAPTATCDLEGKKHRFMIYEREEKTYKFTNVKNLWFSSR